MEVLTVTGLALLVVFLLGETSALASKSFERVQSTGTSATKFRYIFESFIEDIRISSATLCKYPVATTAAFTADDDKVLILKQPMFDTNNDVLPTKHKVVIYKLEAAATAEDGPYVLQKYTATIDGTSESAPAHAGTVAKNIASGEWTTQVNQVFVGNKYNTEFWLFKAPKTPTAEIKTLILVGGVDRLTDGNATITGSKVTFVKPPSYGVVVDASYRGQETTNIDSTGNNGGSSVFVRFKMRTKWRTAGEEENTRDVTFSSRPQLTNRPE
jgi:hypothetical protein